jgi:hypothetical protein
MYLLAIMCNDSLMQCRDLYWLHFCDPIAVEGDHGARLALLTTLIVMLLLKKPLLAIAAGILAAALFRQYFV